MERLAQLSTDRVTEQRAFEPVGVPHHPDFAHLGYLLKQRNHMGDQSAPLDQQIGFAFAVDPLRGAPVTGGDDGGDSHR